jgi:phosphoribosyl 1,2-cyclic phosphodiesterase
MLGVGNAGSPELGNAAAVVEAAGTPVLLIDCGFDTLRRFQNRYGGLPRAVYMTHLHLDHVAGLEELATRRLLGKAAPVRLYVPYLLVAGLHRRFASMPNWLAEGGANFWDAFQLIPVGDEFWHEGAVYRATPARHHSPDAAFGLSLPGRFFYSGDTRPIPEVLARYASHGEPVLHDCGVASNPSHTGLEDMRREYSVEQRRRMWLYHFEGKAEGRRLEAAGYRVAWPGARIDLGSAGVTAVRELSERGVA